MITAYSISEIDKAVFKAGKENKTVGLVPTMGYLHEGHLSLMKKAKEECDFTVVSIFVNPAQFGAGEDFNKYPRDLKRDFMLADSAGVDAVFCPEANDMYPEEFDTYVEVEHEMAEKLCGGSRPGHFKGVTTVVAKLFNILQPDRAYFGQKDAQQYIIIKKMVRDLDFKVKIIVCPIVREKDGLAMSSRNTYLTDDQRKQAAILYKALKHAQSLIECGERDAKLVKENVRKLITTAKDARIDYIECVGADNLEEMPALQGRVLIAAAVKFGNTRLLDNIRLEV